MMRWLKDKKREKRTNPSQSDDQKEDDYGFGKEKAASKSPSSRRELPPTPAAPREMSPHIYEEIPDLSSRCMSDNERAVVQGKFGRIKSGLAIAAGTVHESAASVTIQHCSFEKDEISPYLIVPVDNEVRQTPTDFHRNGTPEVHCDVIVKDTHCEILLTRKPKVGAFRLDNPALSAAGENDGDRRNIRNNTHFCSRDRRASSYVQSSGNISSAFSATSSIFSSTSATKIHSGVASSTLTLGNLIESQEPCQEDDFDKAEEKGVVTYSTASNFIPRATKLVFNPLPGKNPRKEAFGSDSSDELHLAVYSSIKDEAGCASLATSRENQSGSRCVTYATVECRDNLERNTESHVTYSSVQDQHFTNSQMKPNYSFDDEHHSQFNVKQQKSLPDSSNDSNSFGGSPKTGIIRSLSPSNSSNCIYALVTFPSDPKHYNTISDFAPRDFQENEPCQEGSFKSMVYSSIDGRFGVDTDFPPCIDDKCDTRKLQVFPRKTSFHFNDTPGELSHSSCHNFSERIQSLVNENRFRFDSNSENYRGIVDQTGLKDDHVTDSSARPDNCANRKSGLHTSQGESNIQLEFCFCSNDQSLSCNCADTKHAQDDDLDSVAGAAVNDGSNSCRSCGRLIRQITYSESYSDETYDHVYSSRLLIKTGRRFSSPDITFSEVSNSEFHDIQNARSVDFPYSVSRDDSWASTRNSDILPPSYSASAESKLFYSHIPLLTEQIRVGEFDRSHTNRESSEHFQCPFVNSENEEQQNCLATSEHVPARHTLNCSVSGSSAIASVKQSNNELSNESWRLKTENIYILNKPGQSSASSKADQCKSIFEYTVGKTVVENYVYEKSAAERPVADDKSVADKSVVERSVADMSVVDRSVADKSVVDRSVADKSKKQDKSIADKSVVDRSVADKSKKHDKSIVDTSVVDRSITDKSVVDRSVAEKSKKQDKSIDDKSVADKSKKQDKSIDDKSVADKSKKQDKSIDDKSVADKSKKQDKSIDDKSVADKSKKQNSDLSSEPKNSGFTGLLTKFSRTKSQKSAKLQSAETSNRLVDPIRCDKDLEEIPEKNTKKLSYFFQRLAIKECTNDSQDCVPPQETDGLLTSALLVHDVKLTGKSLRLLSFENNTTPKNHHNYCQNEKQSTSLHTMSVTDEDAKSYAEILEEIAIPPTRVSPRNNQSLTTGPSIGANSDQVLTKASTSTSSKNVTVTTEGILSHSKPQFKTDSGDTCYEYDISTSSEGEQPGCDYFLSNVKNSLSLDREVQHLAEASFVRRKCLCKRCKNEGLYTTIDDDEGNIYDRDGLCPHLAVKIGDMGTIFEDLIVDQRAAILDCLSDNTFSPYGSRGHGQDGYCRECGCEILTSDSESLTTVCSILSRQFKMTSPNGQPMSCDSDEGTMADNSCESADENGESKSNGSSSKGHYDGHSSGYDEPKGKSESAGQKSRRKERKDKKTVSSTVTHFTTNESERLSLTLSNTMHDDSPTEALIVQTLKCGNKTIIPPVSSESQRKNIFRKNTSTPLSAYSSRYTVGLPGSESKDDQPCDVSRSRPSSIADKVLQDIYAPLPSKALSLLTSRSYSSPVGLTCTCGRGLQAPLATVAAHLAAGTTKTPSSWCTKSDNTLTPSLGSIPHCDGDKKVGGGPVQKYSEKCGKAGSEVEKFILSEKEDNTKNEQRTMDVHSEKEVIVNKVNSCSPTQKNTMSNECLASHTKPGNHALRKEHSPVLAKEGSPLRNRPHTTKQIYESKSRSDCGVFASTQLEKRGTQMSLPHTTKDSVVSTLNAEITVAVSPEHLFNKIPYNDSYERSFVELKTENSKTECARKHRLKIVALDLLPESVVDGDSTETTHSLKKHAIHPKRSKVIEKMAKLFESNSDGNQKITKIKENTILDSATKKDKNHKARPHQKYTCEFDSQNVAPHAQNNLMSENVLNSPHTRSRQSAPASGLFNLARQDNLCGPPENHNLNLNANPPVSDQPATSKTLRSRSRSKQGKENETKARSDNESGRLKSGKIKSGKPKSPYQTDSRIVQQRSLTQSSSSSVSSSSSSKRKSGHKKHKMSKKSYHRKRSKHRSERSKNGHGKEERTYYYFSSDFSDIDVVEVLNCEPGASKDTSINNKLTLINKKRCASSDDLLINSQDNVTDIPVPAANNINEGADGGFGEQEAYAIPVSSSDLRGRKNSNEPGASPQPSPEMTKYRKMKRTDVYKSRKSNNKLLSDLIIRNYDMQIYGNI